MTPSSNRPWCFRPISREESLAWLEETKSELDRIEEETEQQVARRRWIQSLQPQTPPKPHTPPPSEKILQQLIAEAPRPKYHRQEYWPDVPVETVPVISHIPKPLPRPPSSYYHLGLKVGDSGDEESDD